MFSHFTYVIIFLFKFTLFQDVIDLRKANWVKRREEAGPKTIDQIHNDAKKEEIRTKIANMTEPPPPRKSEDRRRSQMARKESRQDQRQDESNWNNVPTKVVVKNIPYTRL